MLCHFALWHCWRAQIERPAPAVVPHLCFTQATNVEPYLLLPSFTVPVNQNFVLISFEQIFKRIIHKLAMLTWSVNIPAVNSERRNTTYFLNVCSNTFYDFGRNWYPGRFVNLLGSLYSNLICNQIAYFMMKRVFVVLIFLQTTINLQYFLLFSTDKLYYGEFLIFIPLPFPTDSLLPTQFFFIVLNKLVSSFNSIDGKWNAPNWNWFPLFQFNFYFSLIYTSDIYLIYLATNAGITSNNSNLCHQLNLNDSNSSSNSNSNTITWNRNTINLINFRKNWNGDLICAREVSTTYTDFPCSKLIQTCVIEKWQLMRL